MSERCAKKYNYDWVSETDALIYYLDGLDNPPNIGGWSEGRVLTALAYLTQDKGYWKRSRLMNHRTLQGVMNWAFLRSRGVETMQPSILIAS